MTLLHLILNASGLSQREAARFLNADERTVRRWIAGQYPAPPGVIAELHDLVSRQQDAAEETIGVIESAIAADPDMEALELGISADDHEAQSLGWPTASAHAAVIGRLTGMLPPDLIDRVVIVPRGSTVATAAAAEQH